MKPPANRLAVSCLNRFNALTLQRFNGRLLLALALFFSGNVRAQLSLPDMITAGSVSGQFFVAAPRQKSPLANQPFVAADTNLLRLEPALLAVSAERIKQSLWRKLGVSPTTPWRGKISLVLHPARALDENVTIVSQHFSDGWNYRVALPDVLTRERFARALTGVVLLEFANRRAGSRSAEIPAWLAEGLSQDLLATELAPDLLSAPNKVVNGLDLSRLDSTARGLDSLAHARRVLSNFRALTFQQLSWPTDAQLTGADGGVYRASAQLFVTDLLALKNGGAELRALLENLPRFYNWQTAFFHAFSRDFSKPLDVEKWWALQVVDFAACGPGARWTPAVSRDKLDEILRVPVETRAVSNSLPARAEISLQSLIRNFDSARQAEILQIKLRDLGLIQLRVASRFAGLIAGYRRVIADYLGEHKEAAPVLLWNKHISTPARTSARVTLKKLDALDARRRAIEAAVKPDIFAR